MAQGSAKATGSVGMDVDAILDMSEYNGLNNPFGYSNNPLASPDMFGHSFELGRRPSFFNISSKVAESVLSKDNLLNTGPYNGIVLRVDSVETFKQASEESELDRILNGGDGDNSTLTATITVRIPELHLNLPVPKTVVQPTYEKSSFDNLGDSAAPCQNRIIIDNAIADMYPKFAVYTREGEDAKTPAIGSYVRVDFANRYSQTGGFYLGPLTDRLQIMTTKLYDIAFGAFEPPLDNVQGEENIAEQPKGQFLEATPTDDSQVAKPKSIKKPKNASTQVPLGDWGDAL